MDNDVFIENLGEMIEYNLNNEDVQFDLASQRFEDSNIKKYFEDRMKSEINLVEKNPKLGNMHVLHNRIDLANLKIKEYETIANRTE